MICGYSGEGGKGICSEDSGGPFVCNNGGKAIIAGVVSWDDMKAVHYQIIQVYTLAQLMF